MYRLVWVYSCQNNILLEIPCHSCYIKKIGDSSWASQPAFSVRPPSVSQPKADGWMATSFKCLLDWFYLFFRQDTFDLNPIGNPVYDTYKVSQAPKVSFQKRGFLAQAVFAGKPSFTGISTIGPRREKTCLRGSDKMRFKPACSATETS